ncbi:uncharacterized protein [Diabrotica undecimpunctata]|uniref:uncharacterized protein n=1 Tax=Diabrotica undecimpunctata TaxID=50387 RepID=UPI003B634175
MVRKISGKNTPNHINFLEEKQKIYTSPLGIANILANSFERFSSDDVLPGGFLIKKEREESKGIDIPPDDHSPLNYSTTMDELEYLLSNTKNSSPGPNNIPEICLQKLPSSAKKHLLNIYNNIWRHSKSPKIWSSSIVIPIYKQN